MTLFSDIAMATSQTRQHSGVVRRCAKAPCDVQNLVRAAEKSVTSIIMANWVFLNWIYRKLILVVLKIKITKDKFYGLYRIQFWKTQICRDFVIFTNSYTSCIKCDYLQITLPSQIRSQVGSTPKTFVTTSESTNPSSTDSCISRVNFYKQWAQGNLT